MKKVDDCSLRLPPQNLSSIGRGFFQICPGAFGGNVLQSGKTLTIQPPHIMDIEEFLADMTVLPRTMSAEDMHYLKTCGFVFGDELRHNRLLITCQSPKGWRKEKSPRHATKSTLVDPYNFAHAILAYRPTSNGRDSYLEVIR